MKVFSFFEWNCCNDGIFNVIEMDFLTLINSMWSLAIFIDFEDGYWFYNEADSSVIRPYVSLDRTWYKDESLTYIDYTLTLFTLMIQITKRTGDENYIDYLEKHQIVISDNMNN